MSDSVRPHRRQPTRLSRLWDSPAKNTGVGCHFLLQCTKVKSENEVAQSCLTLSDPMDCTLPGSSIHGIFQAKVLEWGAIAFSRGREQLQAKEKALWFLHGLWGHGLALLTLLCTLMPKCPRLLWFPGRTGPAGIYRGAEHPTLVPCSETQVHG